MPLFEYRCTACGRRFEVLQSRREEAAPHCPACGGADTERVLSAFAVTKGAGSVPAAGPCGSSDCACLRRDHAN